MGWWYFILLYSPPGFVSVLHVNEFCWEWAASRHRNCISRFSEKWKWHCDKGQDNLRCGWNFTCWISRKIEKGWTMYLPFFLVWPINTFLLHSALRKPFHSEDNLLRLLERECSIVGLYWQPFPVSLFAVLGVIPFERTCLFCAFGRRLILL